MAAMELSEKHAVTVLEARPVAGGRIRTIRDAGFTTPVEWGPEFVHGKLPITMSLLKDAGLSYTAITGKLFNVENGVWTEQRDMIDGWDNLIEQMRSIKTDITLARFLDIYYREEKDAPLRAHVIRYAQGFDLADAERVSVQSLYKEWSQEEGENFRIDRGYDTLIDFMCGECRNRNAILHFETVVERLEWKENKARLYAGNGETFEANRVIITVPLSLLQTKQITFQPEVPEYDATVGDICVGSVIKVVLQFSSPFWMEYQKDIGFIFSNELIPTWWAQAPEGAPILTGWLGGPPSVSFAHDSDEELLEKAISSLSAIFRKPVPELRTMLTAFLLSRSGQDEWTQGAYSYDSPASQTARKVLGTPILSTIYLAGEALYEGPSPGTVEAALSSGFHVAALINNEVG